MSERNAMASLTRWVLAHKRLIVGLWLVVAIGGLAAMRPAGDALSQQFNLPGTEAFIANSRVAAAYGSGGDVAPLVPVVTLPKGTTVDSPASALQLGAALAKVQAALPHARVASYASTHDRAFVSADGRTTFALVYIPARGGVDPGQAEARTAQAALAGVTVGGSPVAGHRPRRAARRRGRRRAGGGTSVLVEALVAGVGALLVLAFVFASFMAIVPLLMALVAIPTTFLLVWPLATVTDVSVIVKFLVALVGLGDRHRLRAAGRRPLARGAPARRACPNEQAVRQGDAACRPRGRLQRHHGRHLAAGARRPAGALPAQHRHRGHAHPAGQRRRRDHPAAGRPGDHRAEARLAAHAPRGPRESRLVGLGPLRRAPPLGRGRAVHRRPGRARLRRLLDPARQPARRLARAVRAPRASVSTSSSHSGIGTGPLSPFDALVRSGDPERRRPRPRRRRRRPQRRRARGLAPRRHRAGHRHPDRRTATRPRAGRRSTASARRSARCRQTSSPAARPRRAPTSSTRSTATSRS